MTYGIFSTGEQYLFGIRRGFSRRRTLFSAHVGSLQANTLSVHVGGSCAGELSFCRLYAGNFASKPDLNGTFIDLSVGTSPTMLYLGDPSSSFTSSLAGIRLQLLEELVSALPPPTFS